MRRWSEEGGKVMQFLVYLLINIHDNVVHEPSFKGPQTQLDTNAELKPVIIQKCL